MTRGTSGDEAEVSSSSLERVDGGEDSAGGEERRVERTVGDDRVRVERAAAPLAKGAQLGHDSPANGRGSTLHRSPGAGRAERPRPTIGRRRFLRGRHRRGRVAPGGPRQCRDGPNSRIPPRRASSDATSGSVVCFRPPNASDRGLRQRPSSGLGAGTTCTSRDRSVISALDPVASIVTRSRPIGT